MKNPYVGLGDESNFASYHPVVTFLYFCSVIIISMFSMNPVFLALTLFGGLVYSVVLQGWSCMRFYLLFAVPVLVFTMILNPLANHRGVTVLFYLNGNAITMEAILYGLASAAMLVSVVIWFSCFNKIMTADKIIYLFGRVVPVIALLISMCFRFVPLLKSRFREIHQGQRGMGRKFGKWDFIKKGRLLAKELSILIAWSLEAAIETSDSMTARGYGLRGRTSFHIFKFTKRDKNLLVAILLLTVIVMAGCFYGVNNIYYYPAILFPTAWRVQIPIAVCYFLLLILPTVVDIKGEQRWLKLN